MPRFLLARDAGIDLGRLTQSGAAALTAHYRRWPSERMLLMLVLSVLVRANTKKAVDADRMLSAMLPGMYGDVEDRVCAHPACTPERCVVAEIDNAQD